MTKAEQYNILMKFFGECVRYWEITLKSDSDFDKQPYINAIAEIPTHYPYSPQGELFNEDVRENFIKDRYMDTYGKDWEKYYQKKGAQYANN